MAGRPEQLPQLEPGPGQSGPHRADGDVQGLGHLHVGEARAGHEQEHVEVAGVDLTQSPGDGSGLAPEPGGGRHVVTRVLRRHGAASDLPVPRLAPTLGAPVVPGEVGGDAEQPRTGVRTVRLVGRTRPEGGGERVADEVLGGTGSHPRDQVPVHRSGVPFEDRGEGFGVGQ